MPIVQIRVDDQIKDDAELFLEKMGLTLAEAVRMFLARVVADQAIPFRAKPPGATPGAPVGQTRRQAPVNRPATALEELERELSAKPPA